MSAGAQSLWEESRLLEGDRGEPKLAHLGRPNLKRITISTTPWYPYVHGLHLLRQLIEDKDTDVISLDFVIRLHLNQLKDPEPFIA